MAHAPKVLAKSKLSLLLELSSFVVLVANISSMVSSMRYRQSAKESVRCLYIKGSVHAKVGFIRF